MGGFRLAATDPSGSIRENRSHLEQTAGRAYTIVVLLGKNGKGLEERRQIARGLEQEGMTVLIPEDYLPREVSPSLAEGEMLTQGDQDLVFLDVDSWGTATEFGQFHDHRTVAPKLRVLVRVEYHPLYQTQRSYLTDMYLTHLAVFGHVYPIGAVGAVNSSNARDLITLLATRYAEVKRIKPELTR